jgi:hypothetical protein
MNKHPTGIFSLLFVIANYLSTESQMNGSFCASSASASGRPDEFAKKSPKMRHSLFLLKSKQNSCREKSRQKCLGLLL